MEILAPDKRRHSSGRKADCCQTRSRSLLASNDEEIDSPREAAVDECLGFHSFGWHQTSGQCGLCGAEDMHTSGWTNEFREIWQQNFDISRNIRSDHRLEQSGQIENEFWREKSTVVTEYQCRGELLLDADTIRSV
ncbi:hypothetical protein C8J56DRAFT_895504 [Mycena floridula]|nr:hypothetical protein C8J56DRAFT_895504 [Mycena floridula]